MELRTSGMGFCRKQWIDRSERDVGPWRPHRRDADRRRRSSLARRGLRLQHWEIGSICEFLSHESGYRIGNLAPGSYVLRFSIPGYRTEFSGGVTEYFSATSVSVQAGGVTAASADLKVAPGIR